MQNILQNLKINKCWLLGVFIVALVVITLWIFAFSPPTILESENARSIGTQKIQTSKQEKERPARRGLQFLGAGTYKFTAVSSDGGKTYAQQQIKPFRVNRINLEITPVGSAQKLAGGTQSCAFTSGTEIFSYKCNLKTKILQHAFTTKPEATSAFFGDDFYNLVPVNGGVVGFRYVPNSSPEFIYTNGSSLKKISLPVGEAALSVFKIATSGKSVAVLNSVTSTVYYFKDTNSSPKALKLNLPEGIKTLEGSYLNLVDSRLTIKTPNPDFKNTFTSEKNDGVWLINLSVSDSEVTPRYTLKLPADQENSSTMLIPIAESLFADRYIDRVVIFKNEEGSLSKIFELPYTDSLISQNNNTYTVYNGGIYQLNLNNLNMQLVYESPRWEVLKLLNLGDSIGFTAKLKDDSQKNIHFFKLSQTPQVGDARQDTLPYTDKRLSIRTMDFKDNKIYMQLILNSYISDRAENQVTFDNKELLEKTATVRNRLTSDGFTNSNSQITISF